MDIKAINQYAFLVWSQRQGAVVSQMIHLGDRLGLFGTMMGQGFMSPVDLADSANVSERYAEEWLRCLAAAGLLDHDAGTFALSDVGAAVLADRENSPFFSAAGFTPVDARAQAERLEHAFRSDSGHGYDAGGAALVETLEGMNSPWARLVLPTVVVGSIPGFRERLERGVQVVDVGCGAGHAVAALARTFEASTFRGIDPSLLAIERAHDVLADIPNATASVGSAEDMPVAEVDVVTAFDCLHDMARPDRALASIRQALKDDGLLVVKDIKTALTFEEQQKNPMLAMMYGLSVMSCLPSGMSTDDGMALGNQGLPPEKLEQLVREAGFTGFAVHDLKDPVNMYYEVTP